MPEDTTNTSENPPIAEAPDVGQPEALVETEVEVAPEGLPENPIEGGDVIDVGADSIGTKPSHRERTARTFTFTLLGIFAGSLLLHYAALLTVLAWHDKEGADIIQKQFNSWLPVLSGLVGSSATYYLTREKS